METAYLTRKDLREELGEFTEQILLPAVERIVDDKVGTAVGMLRGEMGSLTGTLRSEIGTMRSDLIDFVDRRIATSTGEIIATIKGDRERDHAFKIKILEVFRRHKLLPEDDLHTMEALVR